MPHYYRLMGYQDDTAHEIGPMIDDLGPLCCGLSAKLRALPVRWDSDIYFAIATAKEICRYAVEPDGSSFMRKFDKVEVLHRRSGSLIAWTDGHSTWKLEPM